MSKLWTTIITLKGTYQTIKTNIITYFKSIFQGHSLSLIIFKCKPFIVYDKTLAGLCSWKRP